MEAHLNQPQPSRILLQIQPFEVSGHSTSSNATETFQLSTFPGNLNSSHPTEKFIFHQKLTLEAEELEGQLHRVDFTLDVPSDFTNKSLARHDLDLSSLPRRNKGNHILW